MSQESATNFIIFYAWQDDLPSSTNKNMIRHALREASSSIESEFTSMNLHIVLDEATRGESGSPNIPATILSKIDVADVFVCDVTSINGTSSLRLPNPNVVFELGYAVSRLGWGRIILLFNKEFGKFPDDIPFDFDRHRASPYSCTVPDEKALQKELAARRQPLAHMLYDALRAILEMNPDKPFKVLQMTEDQIKRTRDIANLKWLMSKVNIPTLDIHITELPTKIYGSVFFFWEDFKAVAGSSLFNLYDNEALRLVEEVRNSWGNTLSYGHCYHNPSGRDIYSFISAMDMDQKKDWEELEKNKECLFNAFRGLLSHIRKNYIEINLEELSHDAWMAYVKSEKELAERLKEPK